MKKNVLTVAVDIVDETKAARIDAVAAALGKDRVETIRIATELLDWAVTEARKGRVIAASDDITDAASVWTPPH